jgi:hypothetical protein
LTKSYQFENIHDLFERLKFSPGQNFANVGSRKWAGKQQISAQKFQPISRFLQGKVHFFSRQALKGVCSHQTTFLAEAYTKSLIIAAGGLHYWKRTFYS